MRRTTTEEAKQRLKGYIQKYYCEVRDDVFNWDNFQHELYGYVVSLSHNINGYNKKWQNHNHRQALRRYLYSFALNEIETIDRRGKTKEIIKRIFTFGLVWRRCNNAHRR